MGFHRYSFTTLRAFFSHVYTLKAPKLTTLLSCYVCLSSPHRAVGVSSQVQPLVLASLQNQREKHQQSKQKPHRHQYRQTVGVEKVWAVPAPPPVVRPPPVTSHSPLSRSRAHQEKATALLCTGWQTWPHRKPRMTQRVSKKWVTSVECVKS